MDKYTLTNFTPAEVEKITGLSTMMQRDWRRRGFLPTTAGHARFDPFALAEVFVMKLLADRGVGPINSRDVAEWCGIGILCQALKSVDAYEGDHHRTHEWQPEGIRPKSDPEMEKHIRDIASSKGLDISGYTVDTNWGWKAEWLSKQVLQLRGHGRIIPARFFIWWADGSHVWSASVDDAFSGSPYDAKYAGPVIVLDLVAVAETLLDRTERALVHVEFETDDAGNVVLHPVPSMRSNPATDRDDE